MIVTPLLSVATVNAPTNWEPRMQQKSRVMARAMAIDIQ